MEHVPTEIDRPVQTILFIGGCHVIGYPVGIEAGFPSRCVAYLRKYDCNYAMSLLPYVKNTHAARIAAKVGEVKPSIIVLQLGHFELTGGVSRARIFKNQSVSRVSEAPGSGPFESIQSRVIWGIRNIFKMGLALLGVGPKIDWALFEEDFELCIRSVRQAFDGPIVFLSPFDCADSVVRGIRVKAIPIYRRLSSRYDLIYVDAAKMMLKKKGGGRLGYFDGIHMDSLGHDWIAKRIVDVLCEHGAVDALQRSGRRP